MFFIVFRSCLCSLAGISGPDKAAFISRNDSPIAELWIIDEIPSPLKTIDMEVLPFNLKCSVGVF